MNFILFNGPPRSGKDTAAKFAYDYIKANHLNRLFPLWEKFSFPNKRAFAGMMGAVCDSWGVVEPYEQIKDEPIQALGFSYRQWQIDYSEKFMKPVYGQDIFGRLLLDRLAFYNMNLFVPIVSDCGFQVECDVLRDHNVLLFTLYREECSFEGDSREYVEPAPGWRYHDLVNEGSLDDLRAKVETAVKDWFHG